VDKDGTKQSGVYFIVLERYPLDYMFFYKHMKFLIKARLIYDFEVHIILNLSRFRISSMGKFNSNLAVIGESLFSDL